jgi:ABC-type transport system substrate-binding protein
MILMLLMSLAVIAAANLFSTAKAAPPANTLIYATDADPISMDPVWTWDTGSNDVIDQVCQGLYWYNLTEPNAPLEPLLASAMPTVSANGTQYDIPLRTGVVFQDGTPFNATAVQDNFNRLAFFVSPACPAAQGQTDTYSLFQWANGTNIIKNTKVLSNYEIQINLNVPYGPFLNLLTFTACYMMSPTELAITNCTQEYLQYSNTEAPFGSGNAPFVSENMTGTGPYTFGGYSAANAKVYLTANPLYWGKPAHIHYVVFDLTSNPSNIMLDKSDSFAEGVLPSDFATAKSTPGLTVDNGPLTLTIECVSMNDLVINETFRKALAYCFDYNYFLNTIDLGLNAPLHGVIPQGMNYYNASIPYPTMNVTVAREVLISAKLVPSSQLTNDTFWWDLSYGNPTGYTNPWTGLPYDAPLASFNFTYNTDSLNRADVGMLLQADAADIGISVTRAGTTWANFLNLLTFHPMSMGMFDLGWAPDYNDPDDYVGPLLTPSSSDGAILDGLSGANPRGTGDPTINTLANEARETDNSTLRQLYYNELSLYIQNVSFPYIWLDQGVSRCVHLSTLQGFPDNSLDEVCFAPCYYISLPGAPTSLSAQGYNGYDYITWSPPASNGGSPITGYKIYCGTSPGQETYVTTIGNVTHFNDLGLTNGQVYYFTVAAVNAAGAGTNASETSAMPIGPPDAPTGLQAAAGNGQITLTWTAPANNSGSPITGYKIYRGLSSGSETLETTVGNVTTFTDTGLTNGQAYYYTVSAVNGLGEGAKSAEQTATPHGASIPGFPAGITLCILTAACVSLAAEQKRKCR